MTANIRTRAVFLDRDGTVNEIVLRNGKPGSPRNVEEFRFCQGVEQILNRLATSGFRLFIVTNQPDLARGTLLPSVVEEINRRILAALPIEHILTCPHDDHHKCECRKPKSGLLRQIADREGIDLPHSYMVGDSWRDMEAGRTVGCTTVLISRAYNEGTDADYRADSLVEAGNLIIGAAEHAA